MSTGAFRDLVSRLLNLTASGGEHHAYLDSRDTLVFNGQRVAFVSGLAVVRQWVGATWDGQWRCLGCGLGGYGDKELVSLALSVHVNECTGSKDVAGTRWALVRALHSESLETSGDGWSPRVVEALLFDGRAWALAANLVGWPVGEFGLEGWDTDFDSVLARYGSTRDTFYPRRIDLQ